MMICFRGKTLKLRCAGFKLLHRLSNPTPFILNELMQDIVRNMKRRNDFNFLGCNYDTRFSRSPRPLNLIRKGIHRVKRDF
jgi:hypothetical protein